MKKEPSQIGFELQLIKLEQFATLEDNYSKKKEANLSTSMQFKLDHQAQQIVVFMGFEFVQGKKMFLKIVVSCLFKIDDESWKGFIHEVSKVVLPKTFMAHLTMITTGTSRGILFSKTESTPFSQFILPTINVTEMIADDVVFDLPDV